MVRQFRARFGNVPFVVRGVARFRINCEFNRALRTVDDGNVGTRDVEWARCASLDTFGGTHFDSPSMRRLVRRYITGMQQLLG